MDLVQSQTFRHLLRHGGGVPRQHDGTHALRFQRGDGLPGGGLFLVGNQHRAQKCTVPRHVHHGARALRGGERHAGLFHQSGVARQHGAAVHQRFHAMPGNFLYIADLPGRIRRGLPQTFGDGMAGVAFRQRGSVEQVLLRHARSGGEPRHREHALGQGAGLVKHCHAGVGQRFQIVAALHKDAAAGRAADAPKEGEGNGDDHRTGAGDDQEGERPHEPGHPAAAQHQRRQHCQSQRRKADGGGVIPGKFGDEVLDFGFFEAGIFHQLQNFGHGGFPVGLGGLNAQKPVPVDTAADDLLAGTHCAGAALTGEGRGVQAALAGQHPAVNGHLLAGAHHNDGTHRHLLRVHGGQAAVPAFQIGTVRPDVHQRGDAAAAFAHSVALEQLAHLIEQHDGHALTVFAAGHGAHGGNRHQEVFVKNFAVFDAQNRLFQHVMADDKIGHQPQRQL